MMAAKFTYAKDSGIAVTVVRVSQFRSLANIELVLGDLTVIIGANNAGKTSFLDALFAAIGAGRKLLDEDDVRIAPGEPSAPKDRQVTIDLKVQPIDTAGLTEGKPGEVFPGGGFWTALWSYGVINDGESPEFVAIRTTLAWNAAKGEYVLDRRFLKEWRPFADWLETPTHDRSLGVAQLEPLALHFIDAKRDLEDDLRRQGSFWRRMTSDLGLSPKRVVELERMLSEVNQQILQDSAILGHLAEHLSGLRTLVSADGTIDIAPIARKLRELSKGFGVSFSTAGAQSFPLARHGMGTRSLASLLVFRAFASWQNKSTTNGDKNHLMLALEEPESHLHPHAQRSLFSHIKAIAGQRIVSTHSPYFAGQAQLEDLRLFLKSGADTVVSQLDLSGLSQDDRRKLQDTVLQSRGDILFAQAVVLFEGQTEEIALPIWAQKYWGMTIHELGFCFVCVHGTDYFPFLYLAKSLGIPWYIFADGERDPVAKLNKALKKANEHPAEGHPNVVVLPDGRNFETELIYEGYEIELGQVLDEVHDSENYLADYIKDLHGEKKKGGVLRDYKSPGGATRALTDAIAQEKTALAKAIASKISELPPPRHFPSSIQRLLEHISQRHNLTQANVP